MNRPRSPLPLAALLAASLWSTAALAREFGGGEHFWRKPPLGVVSWPAGLGSTGFQARAKWFTSAVALPKGDAWRAAATAAMLVDHNADMRTMWRRRVGRAHLEVDHSIAAVSGDTVALGGVFGLPLGQTPTDDHNRLFDWTWELARGSDVRLLHRFDRLTVGFGNARWGLTIGRQAMTWGRGMVFSPMDFLSPFAPTSVDHDYKPGDDMVRFGALLGDDDDFRQVDAIIVGRRTGDGGDSRADWNACSVAGMYLGSVGGSSDVIVVGARHRGDEVLGLGVQAGLWGSGFLSTDVVWWRHDGGMTLSGVLNATWGVGSSSSVRMFAEYHHNGFGVRRLPADLDALPTTLRNRLRRGELHTLMRDYAAVGASISWHFLLQQSVSLISNLHDGSHVWQTALTYNSSDASRIHVGLLKPFGNIGDEFGRRLSNAGTSSGGGGQAFARLVYYF